MDNPIEIKEKMLSGVDWAITASYHTTPHRGIWYDLVGLLHFYSVTRFDSSGDISMVGGSNVQGRVYFRNWSCISCALNSCIPQAPAKPLTASLLTEQRSTVPSRDDLTQVRAGISIQS